MEKPSSTVYCPFCENLLFKTISFVGVVEIVCSNCSKTINWSLLYQEINAKKLLKDVLPINTPEIALAMFMEIILWKSLVMRKLKKNLPITFDFENEYLPEEVVKIVSEGLGNAKSLEDVNLGFLNGIAYFLKK